MPTSIKNIIISIVLGFAAYMAIAILVDHNGNFPATTPELSRLFIIIVAVLIASFIATPRNAPGRKSKAKSSTSNSSGSVTASDAERETGSVKWFNVRKGYGFITRDKGDDVFVHFRNLEGKGRRSVAEGERVSFVITNGDKGLQADKVVSI